MRTRPDPRPGWVRPSAVALLTVVALALVAACGSSGASDPPPGAQPRAADRATDTDGTDLETVRIADLGEPTTALAAHPDEPVLLVARRSGAIYRIRLVDQDGYRVPELDPEPALDLAATVTTDGERGLFDLLFSPDGTRLFVSYTDPDGAVTVARYPFDPADATIDAEAPVLLARLDHPFAGHNGGDLEWLDDDTLLWSLGDMGLTTTDPPLAQDPTVPFGGIVRLDAEATPSSPATAADLAGEVIARGLRNPWRMHVDRRAGRLLIGDVGDNRIEEIDSIDLDELTTGPVSNFGWPYFEGSLRTDRPYAGDESFIAPVFEREHDDEVCAIAAGVTVPEALSTPLAGRFLFGDNCSGDVLALAVDEGDTTTVATIDDQVVAFGEGADDEVYVLGLTGGVWRLDPSGWTVPAPDGPTVDPPPDPETADSELSPDEFAAVCDVRTAFDLLGALPGSAPPHFEAVVTEATSLFDASVERLPATVDPVPLEEVLAAVRAVGLATDWNSGSATFETLFTATTEALAPYESFPVAIATVVDLGAAC